MVECYTATELSDTKLTSSGLKSDPSLKQRQEREFAVQKQIKKKKKVKDHEKDL